jgi:hypothetical protein
MKRVIRLTESDLHNLIQRSVERVLREQGDTLLLQEIAQYIVQKGGIIANPGENELELYLKDGRQVFIIYIVSCNPYLRQGMRSNDYDVPDDPDEIIDDFDVEIKDMWLCDYDDNEVTLDDNGIVSKSLKRVLEIDYSGYDVPSEEEYFFDDDDYYYDQ